MTNHAQNAIIMAAGFGTRMRPLSLKTPKPLIEVSGQPMIESVISALHQNGIHEIYVVVGYLKAQYDYLPHKYDGVQLIDNPYFDSANNISSLYVAREHLGSTIILDGDQIINNPTVIHPDFDRSGYNCVWTPGHTDEWLLTVNDKQEVTHCDRDGGEHGWRLYSVSRWNQQDCQKLRQCLVTEFKDKHHTDIYWDDVAIFCCPEQFHLTVYPMQLSDVREIDRLEDLVKLEPRYQHYLDLKKKEAHDEQA